MSKRVLFVDDEAPIREIYGMLGPFIGDGYTVETACDGVEALKLMNQQPFDVVISDLIMPNMSGIELLTEVAKRFPATGRIAVSGFADEITAAKCHILAHRYYNKPFNPTALSGVIATLCEARTFAANNRIREYVGKIESLPIVSQTYVELLKALRSNAVPVQEVSNIIERDLALTAKVLHMVNSVAIAPARRINSVFEAIQIIGLGVVRSLVLSTQVFEFCGEGVNTQLYRSVWAHSLKTAVCAKEIATSERIPIEQIDEAFLLGLLHDIGKVVLAASCSDYNGIWKDSKNSETLVTRESDLYGADHAHVGAYLLRLWGFPDATVNAIRSHHSLESAEISGFCPLVALHVAQELLPDRRSSQLNEELIGRLGLTERLPVWQAAVAKG